jgi:hypothetical protein
MKSIQEDMRWFEVVMLLAGYWRKSFLVQNWIDERMSATQNSKWG